MRTVRILPGVYQFSGIVGARVWGANIFLLVGDDLTLVDTGYKWRAEPTLNEIRRLGYYPADIRSIIITHHHLDHVGSLAELKNITRARIIAHPADAPYIDGRLPQPSSGMLRWMNKAPALFRRLLTYEPVNVDILVNDGDELPLFGGIRIFHTPGHTPGSICLSIQNKGLVIAGDVIVNRFGPRLPSKAFTIDVQQEASSIKKIASMEFDVICFGHGKPLLHKARPTVIDFANKLQISPGCQLEG